VPISGTLVPPAATLSGVAVTADDGQDTVISGSKLVPRNPFFIDPTQAPYNVKFDRFTSTGASMSSVTNPTQLSVSDYTFVAADVGKHVKVVGAGAGGANLKTTIASVSAGKAILADPCETTVAGAFCIFGTDNAAALNQLFADLSHTGRDRKLARVCLMPLGAAMYSGTLIFPYGGTVKGSSENWQNYDLQYNRGGGSENKQNTVLYQMWDQNVDGARVKDAHPTLQHDWNGILHGFMLEQDLDNTAGNGLAFRNAAGDAVRVIDGGTINRVASMGWAQAGFDFPDGSITATFRDLYTFACGYMDRQIFTADTSSGSHTLSNVSSFTGIAIGGILTGAGIPVDATVNNFDTGAGTITLSHPATATATGVSIQRSGSPGVRYKLLGTETVHFDGLSGDQCSGGLLRLVGPPASTGAAVVITNMKSEFGANVYREPAPTVSPSIPQQSNAIVLDNMQNASVSIRGLTHWADSSSSVGSPSPNTNSLGRDIGAAILALPIDLAAADVTWEALTIRLATGSGQTTKYAFRDNHSVSILPISADLSGKGTNRRKPRAIRTVANVNATISVHDSTVGWTSLTAARTASLPAISAVPAGQEFLLMDMSGSGSLAAGRTITATPAGSDTIIGDAAVSAPYEQLWLVSNGTNWVGVGTSDVVTLATTQTLLNKRLTPRIGTVTSSATPTPDANQHDQYNVNALAEAATFAAPSGTPVHGQEIMIRVKDNGVSQTLAFNAIYRFFVTAPTTTVAGKVMYLRIRFHANDVKWDVLSVAQQP